MNRTIRLELTVLLLLAVSLVFSFSPLPRAMGNAMFSVSKVMLQPFELEKSNILLDSPGIKISIDYAFEILFALIILVLPVCVLGGAWMLRIGYEFSFGDAAAAHAFGFPNYMRVLFSVFCLGCFLYSLYRQYQWLDKPAVGRRNDESRLI